MKWKFWKKDTVEKDGRYEVHKVSGVNFHIVKDWGSNQYSRYISFLNAMEQVSRKMRTTDVLAACDLARVELAKKEYKRADDFIKYIQENAENYNSTRTLSLVANCFILMDGEPKNEINAAFNLKKSQLCESDKAIEFFFINNAIELLKGIGILSKDTSNEDYLNPTNLKTQEMYLKKIGKRPYSE